jgi:hypothetical protein
MIDDHDQAMELVSKMKVHLPIPARPTATMIRALREQGRKIARDQELSIQSVFYAGDEGGIMCGMALSEDAKEMAVVSLTHLRIDPRHPLARDTRVYQRQRTRRLAQSEGPREPYSFTLRPRKKKRRS